jgi:hypothetical protein
VIFGLSAILIGVLRGTQRTFTRVNATQHGRAAIANIENELHSGCVGAGEAPIQTGSTATSVQFVSYYGATASPTPTWHVLTYSSNTLTDTTYGVTGTAGSWVRATAATSTNTVLTNVSPPANGAMFQYFAYAPGSSNTAGVYWFIHDGTNSDPGTPTAAPATAAPLTVASGGLTSTQAQNTVELAINFSVGSDSESINNPSLTAVNDVVDDTISFRLTSPPDEIDATDSASAVAAGTVPDGYEPCE